MFPRSREQPVPPLDPNGDLDQLAYDLATSAIRQQAESLDELRSRTSTLVAVTALVATFLGRTAVSEPHHDVWTQVFMVAALAALAISIWCCVEVLRPTKVRERPGREDRPEQTLASTSAVGLIFTINIERLLDDAEDRGRVDDDSIKLSVARTLGKAWAISGARSGIVSEPIHEPICEPVCEPVREPRDWLGFGA